MTKKLLPIFWRDHGTGIMKELAPSEPIDSPLASGQTGSPPLRVLVADDNEEDRRRTIGQLGKAWPFEGTMVAECAADGNEALEKIRGSRFELIVLDWNMPYQDGSDVLRVMRESGLRTPVVVVSGQQRENIAKDLHTMEAEFVNKNEMNAVSLRNAIAASILLQEGRTEGPSPWSGP